MTEPKRPPSVMGKQGVKYLAEHTPGDIMAQGHTKLPMPEVAAVKAKDKAKSTTGI